MFPIRRVTHLLDGKYLFWILVKSFEHWAITSLPQFANYIKHLVLEAELTQSKGNAFAATQKIIPPPHWESEEVPPQAVEWVTPRPTSPAWCYRCPSSSETWRLHFISMFFTHLWCFCDTGNQEEYTTIYQGKSDHICIIDNFPKSNKHIKLTHTQFWFDNPTLKRLKTEK